MSRFVRPDTTILKISQGDTLTVKRRLNAGEQRAMFARMYLAGVDGHLRANPFQAAVSRITAYLIDWSLTDDAGTVVPIRDRSTEALTTVLDGLDPETFTEIREAIDAHEIAMDAEREQEKNAPGGERPSPAISPSRSAVAGGTTTSEPLIPTYVSSSSNC